jgi:HlyD family secretion protein
MPRKVRLLWSGIAIGSFIALVAAGCAIGGPVLGNRSDRIQPLGPGGASVVALAPGDANVQGQGVAVAVTPTSVVLPAGTRTIAATPTSAPRSTRQTVAARRGTIVEETVITGRVAGDEEQPLSVQVAGRVSNVTVKVGDEVRENDVLVELDSSALARDMRDLQEKVDLATVRIQGMRSQAQGRQSAAVAQARDRLQSAQTDLARIQQGASAADRAAAQATLVQAQTNLARATAVLEQLKTGPNNSDIQQAQQRVGAADMALKAAQSDQVHLTQGATPAQLLAAQRDVAAAQLEVTTAQSEFDRVKSGPTQFELRAAERAVQQAQAALAAADSARTGAEGLSPEAKNAGIATARAQLGDAKDRLALLKQPPTAAAIDEAKQRLERSSLTLDAAQASLHALQAGPSASAVEAANAAVQAQQQALAVAKQQLKDASAGASADEIAAATADVQSATAAREAAQARVDEVLSHPTDAELADAAARVGAMQAALQAAQSGGSIPDAGQGGDTDLASMQASIEQDRVRLGDLRQQVEAMRLRAPITGVVAALQVVAGDSVDASKVIGTIATPGAPVVRAFVSDGNPASPRGRSPIAQGQSAGVILTASRDVVPATVLRVEDNPDGPGRIATLSASWPEQIPAYGTTVQARVAVQTKHDVLLVPLLSIHGTVGNQYVQYEAAGTLRTSSVATGLSNGTDVEVVSGLEEGQTVIVHE